ncbi:MAG: ATP-binding cassette domain-containing protein [Mariprofundaceae bacterium]|nr:ATP-binding cassette domain-containing protein [Mariprofundaceae bacterium]
MIKVSNVYENNLKHISVAIPKNKITTVIGVSGSGKSSLIYNVLAAEARRQEKIDSGHANCLDYAVRPKFERIENLPYCITLKQRGLSESISSTLATVSGLHALLRAELTQYGAIIGDHGNVITEPNISDIKLYIQRHHPQSTIKLFAIVCDEKHTDGQAELSLLNEKNIMSAIFISSYDNKERLKKTHSVKNLNNKYKHTIFIPFESVDELDKHKELALENFRLKVNNLDLKLNTDFFDMNTAKIYQKKSTQLLSFNSSSKHSGKCKNCHGHGLIDEIDLENLILQDKRLSEDFLNLTLNEKGGYKYISLYRDTIDKILKTENLDKNKTFRELSKKEQAIIVDFISPRIIKHEAKPSIGKFIKNIDCHSCKGTRLNDKANAVRLYGLNISELLEKTVDELYLFLHNKKLHHKKILSLLSSLKKSTLGYLPLERTTNTLSGGELQRLKFSLELNSDYNGLLYILDEPSSGLHPYNNHQIISLIKDLCHRNNTIIISEHNQDYIQNSDYIIELGLGGGSNGGEVIFSGKPTVCRDHEFVREKIEINLKHSLKLIQVHTNNIRGEDFIIPLHCLVSITGVSGSGKSSLIHKALVPNIKQYLNDESINPNLIKEIKNIEKINSIVELTQSQIGINSRSIVATYLNIFDDIRTIFSTLQISKNFGFDKGYFSFNSSGACETCKGLGMLNENICPNCLGGKYKSEILDITFNNLNIIDILNNPISNLLTFFDHDKLKFSLKTLDKLGLSHLTLGRETPTLSGGEAQRLKFAESLITSYKKINHGGFLFVLDEPTAGLNKKDTIKMYTIFDEIISLNNSIIIIEHNLDMIKNSDFIIDIGIGSGNCGGKKVFEGQYEELLTHKTSLTAKAFKGEYEDRQETKNDLPSLKTKTFHSHNKPVCNHFYLDGEHFEIEKTFNKNHTVITDGEHHKFFKTRQDLFSFIKKLNSYEVFFNPYVTELFKYKVVPNSIKKDKLKHLKALGFEVNLKDFHRDEWQYRVKTNDIEKAYNFGNGWITVKTKVKSYELFTRLISIKNNIIGTPKISEHTFNLYLNRCIYCNAIGTMPAYDKSLIIKDESKSILDEDFLCFLLKLQVKSIVTKFLKEGLFDFTKPFNQLNEDEKNIFLFGFKEYKFLKSKGKITTLSDYTQWKGLYYLIYDNLSKIEIKDKILNSKTEKTCPFCEKGFRSEVAFYQLNGTSIVDNLLFHRSGTGLQRFSVAYLNNISPAET